MEHWKVKSLAFRIPMVWRELKGHGKECYFCSHVVDEWNVKISIKFNILTCLVLCDRFLMSQVSQFHCLQEFWKQLEDSVSEKFWFDIQLTKSSEYECDDDQQPKLFNQAKLNDLVRDLNLPKASAPILGFRMKAKHMLSTDTTFVDIDIVKMNEYIISLPKNTL